MKFADLVFKPHRDGQPGHWHARCALPDGRTISVTRWNHHYHGSDAERPYEVLVGDEELLEYQTASDIEAMLA